jgi:hypothetical protein
MANDTAESCFSGVTVTAASELREVVVSSVSETADLDKSESEQNLIVSLTTLMVTDTAKSDPIVSLTLLSHH